LRRQAAVFASDVTWPPSFPRMRAASFFFMSPRILNCLGMSSY
jgi:hypothetical protein